MQRWEFYLAAGLFDIERFDFVVEVLLSSFALLMERIEFFADDGQSVFLLVEFFGLAFGQRSLFGGAFQSREVFANALLILGDLIDVGLVGFDLVFE
jgi:hypothetical protein